MHDWNTDINLYMFMVYSLCNPVGSADPPELSQGLTNVTKNESDAILFTCIFNGLPVPSVTWTVPGGGMLVPSSDCSRNVITPTEGLTVSSECSMDTKPHTINSTLLIHTIKKEDEGMHSCLGENDATNLIGAVNRSGAFLTVQGVNFIYFMAYVMH